LRSFVTVAKRKPGLSLVIGGEGPEAENLRSLAQQLGIQDRVEFCGFIPDADLPGYYSRADVFAFPSWTTSGITPYEALAFGCKVVWTSEAEEPVLELPGVHVVDPTPEDFARGLLCALDDSARPPLEKLKTYSWRHYFEGVEQILVQAMGSGIHRLARDTSPESVTVPVNQE
jgi:glycosyltransferase involved in cell wall biosynthesis